jgi:hypothetical protein
MYGQRFQIWDQGRTKRGGAKDVLRPPPVRSSVSCFRLFAIATQRRSLSHTQTLDIYLLRNDVQPTIVIDFQFSHIADRGGIRNESRVWS